MVLRQYETMATSRIPMNMFIQLQRFAACTWCLVAPAIPFELGTPFTDHAILQRGMPVPVWGWTEPGTEVTVSFTEQTVTATADAKGKWILRLAPLAASAEPRTLKIVADDHSRELKDVRLLVSVPNKTLAPSLPDPSSLPHHARTIPVDQWTDGSAVIEAVLASPE